MWPDFEYDELFDIPIPEQPSKESLFEIPLRYRKRTTPITIESVSPPPPPPPPPPSVSYQVFALAFDIADNGVVWGTAWFAFDYKAMIYSLSTDTPNIPTIQKIWNFPLTVDGSPVDPLGSNILGGFTPAVLKQDDRSPIANRGGKLIESMFLINSSQGQGFFDNWILGGNLNEIHTVAHTTIATTFLQQSYDNNEILSNGVVVSCYQRFTGPGGGSNFPVTIDTIIRRSLDSGHTWQSEQIIFTESQTSGSYKYWMKPYLVRDSSDNLYVITTRLATIRNATYNYMLGTVTAWDSGTGAATFNVTASAGGTNPWYICRAGVTNNLIPGTIGITSSMQAGIGSKSCTITLWPGETLTLGEKVILEPTSYIDQGTVFKSTDSGATWDAGTNVDFFKQLGLMSDGITAFTASLDYIYFFGEYLNQDGSHSIGIFRTPVSSPGSLTSNLQNIGGHPINAAIGNGDDLIFYGQSNTLYPGSDIEAWCLWRTTDGGATVTQVVNLPDPAEQSYDNDATISVLRSKNGKLVFTYHQLQPNYLDVPDYHKGYYLYSVNSGITWTMEEIDFGHSIDNF